MSDLPAADLVNAMAAAIREQRAAAQEQAAAGYKATAAALEASAQALEAWRLYVIDNPAFPAKRIPTAPVVVNDPHARSTQ